MSLVEVTYHYSFPDARPYGYGSLQQSTAIVTSHGDGRGFHTASQLRLDERSHRLAITALNPGLGALWHDSCRVITSPLTESY